MTGHTFDDGKWYAGTLGHLVSLLVDLGDVAAVFRVLEDGKEDEQGRFVRRWEVVTVPDGMVVDVLNETGVEGVHKTLTVMLAEGVIT